MNKITKLLIGALTIIPLIYIILFILNFSTNIIDFDLLFNFHIAVMLLTVGLTIFYISNIFKTDNISSEKKILWVIVIFFGHAIAMLVYWYLYIWQDPKEI